MWNLSSLSTSGIHWRRIKVVGELKFFYFLRRLGGKASGRDASGGGRREYYYRNSLEEDVSIITETASFFTKSSNTQGFKLLRPSSKGTKLLSVTVIKAIIIM